MTTLQRHLKAPYSLPEQDIGRLLIAVVHDRPEQHGDGADHDAALDGRHLRLVERVDLVAPDGQHQRDDDHDDDEEDLEGHEDGVEVGGFRPCARIVR